MEIVIHGTKGGYKVLYPQNATMTFVNDFRSPGAIENPVGQSAYALSFIESGCIFSKYAIIRDGLRDMATGTIAVSVLIPHNQKLNGSDAIRMLDLILDQYFKINIVNNNLVHAVDEFSYVDVIKNQFSLHPKISERLNTGKNDPAYIYYESKEHLSKYFDMPFQANYEPFSQVFFVEKNLKDELINPLKVLRHTVDANLSDVIDFQNPEYTISFPNYVKVIANSNKQLHIGDKIKKNDFLTISYYKKFHNPKPTISGKLFESEIEKYVSLQNNTIQINPIVFEPEIKTVKVNVIYNGQTVTDVKISISEFGEFESNRLIEFKGEEIGRKYQISASTKDLTSDTHSFTPENQTEIILKLRKIQQNTTDGSPKSDGKRNVSIDHHRKAKKDGNKTKIFLVSILASIVIFIGLDFFVLKKFIFKNSIEAQIPEEEKIVNKIETITLKDTDVMLYIEDTHYLQDSLKKLKEIWQNQNNDSSIKNWKEIDTILDNAIEKRKDIDAFIFKSSDRPSKKKFKFSTKQEDLKSCFIDLTNNEAYFKEFKDNNKDISVLTLKELIDKIKAFLKSIPPPKSTKGNPPPPKKTEGPGASLKSS
jgi:hypothetical protein